MAALWIGMSGVASAHSSTAALLVVGEDREASLAEAVRGFLLAADERDGHANETSDGHLGGVDVHVLDEVHTVGVLVLRNMGGHSTECEQIE